MARADRMAALVTVYGSVGLILAWTVQSQRLSSEAASVFVLVLWLGFVLAISFTEAWLKFEAPFLPRVVGLDVGRTVFRGLHTVEFCLCMTCWLVSWFRSSWETSHHLILVALTVVLVVQVTFLFRELELRAKLALERDLPKVLVLSVRDKKLLEKIHQEIQEQLQDPALPWIHVTYIVLEVVKAFLLSVDAMQHLKALRAS